MLNVEAPAKLVLTLHSVPPFLVESILALALVVLLAVPLIVDVQLLLESTGKSTRTIVVDYGKKQTVVMHYPVPVRLDSSSNSDLNVQLTSMRTTCSSPTIKRDDESTAAEEEEEEEHNQRREKDMQLRATACLPLERSSPFFPTNAQLPIIDISAFDYDSYRHKLIEASLKRQYGDRQAPGNVVLNSIHLNSISSQSGIELNEKYSHSLFDLIEEYYDASNKTTRETKFMHPLDHFLARGTMTRPRTAERATETNESITELDQLPELLDFRDKSPIPKVAAKPRRWSSIVQTKSSDDESVSPSCRATTEHSFEQEEREVSSSETASSYSSSRGGGGHRRLVRSRASSLSSRQNQSVKTPPSQTSRQWYVGGKTTASFNRNYVQEPSKESFSSSSSRKPTKSRPRPRSTGGIFAWDVPDVPSREDNARPRTAGNNVIESSGSLEKIKIPVLEPDDKIRNKKISSESFVKSRTTTTTTTVSRVPVAKRWSGTKSASARQGQEQVQVGIDKSSNRFGPSTRPRMSLKNVGQESKKSLPPSDVRIKRPFLRARSGKHGAPKQSVVGERQKGQKEEEKKKTNDKNELEKQQLSKLLASKDSKAGLVMRRELKTYITKIKEVLSNGDETLRANKLASLSITEAIIPELRALLSPREIQDLQGLVDRAEKGISPSRT